MNLKTSVIAMCIAIGAFWLFSMGIDAATLLRSNFSPPAFGKPTPPVQTNPGLKLDGLSREAETPGPIAADYSVSRHAVSPGSRPGIRLASH
jgi:hypothetical protein